MFESVALYDNSEILQQGPTGRRLQIMLFDGGLGASSSSKLDGSTETDEPKIMVLEFADDIESSVSKFTIVS